MSHTDQDPLKEMFARARDRAERLNLWLEHLRSADPAFAEASALSPEDMGEWQAAVYLLTGCEVVWAATRTAVLAEHSMGIVIHDLQDPHRACSSSEKAVMQKAAHFSDVDRWPAKFPFVFEEFYFQRWITARHLYNKMPPALTLTERGAR